MDDFDYGGGGGGGGGGGDGGGGGAGRIVIGTNFNDLFDDDYAYDFFGGGDGGGGGGGKHSTPVALPAPSAVQTASRSAAPSGSSFGASAGMDELRGSSARMATAIGAVAPGWSADATTEEEESAEGSSSDSAKEELARASHPSISSSKKVDYAEHCSGASDDNDSDCSSGYVSGSGDGLSTDSEVDDNPDKK